MRFWVAMQNTIYNPTKLIESSLLKPSFDMSLLEGFEPSEWLPRIIEKNMLEHNDHNIYRNLADLYDIVYQPKIQVSVNPKDAIAYRVPTATLIAANLYPFKQDGKLYVATSTPFIEKEVLDNVLSFVGGAGYELVMTNPREIRNALKNLHYVEFSVIAEGKLRHSDAYLSASPPIILRITRLLIAVGLIVIVAAFLLPNSFLLGLFFIINILYIYLNGLRLVTFLKSIFQPHKAVLEVRKEDVLELEDKSLPRYTILVPLRFEANIVKTLIHRLANIDYPPSKLEIFFLVGVDDEKTIKALERNGIDDRLGLGDKTIYRHMSIVRVPKVQIDTKPLVCNYGLRFATGEYSVIYDAEDKPESDQLKKAVVGFQQATLDTVCLQGKLNFYNSRKNMLTRFFALEYGMWYDYFLPGLQLIGSPVPLGGTSNHFVTSALRKAGEWDPYNVTEDADLGMRIYRSNRRTRILDSYTYEEATSTLGGWLQQRSRWEKGFLATLIVHLRHTRRLYKELGMSKFIYGVTVFFGNFYMPFINPLLWVLTLLWVFNIFSMGDLPLFIWLPAVINLVVGNLIHITIHLMAALRMKRYDLAPLALIVPIYWLLISVATFMASIEIYVRPYQWRKTQHGR